MTNLLIALDGVAALLAMISYHKNGFWFYGMLSYVSLFLIAVYAAGFITGDFSLYSENVSVRWLAVDAGLIGYMANDLFWRSKRDTNGSA